MEWLDDVDVDREDNGGVAIVIGAAGAASVDALI